MNLAALTPAQKRFSAMVSQAWFPAQPEVLARVRAGVASKAYINDRSALFADLLSDPSLLIYGVRELSQRAFARGANTEQDLSPRALVMNALPEELNQVFNINPDAIAQAPFRSGAQIAAERMVQALMSASTASLLESQGGGEGELAFCAATFRQLGLLLMAWNHPHVFTRISRQSSAVQSLDEALARVFGISPTTLGLSLARQWHVSPLIRMTMGDEAASENAETQATAKRLQRWCELGERLASTLMNRSSPTNALMSEEVSKAIQEILGSDGVRRVLQAVETACAEVKKHFPEAFVEKVPQDAGVGSVNQNRHLEQVPEFFREQIEFIYNRFSARAEPEQLRSVLDQSIRTLGFSRGLSISPIPCVDCLSRV